MSIIRMVVSATVASAILCVSVSDSFSDSLSGQDRDEELQLLRESNEMMREQLREQEKRLTALEARESTRTASADSGPVIERGDGLQAVVSGVPIRLSGFHEGRHALEQFARGQYGCSSPLRTGQSGQQRRPVHRHRAAFAHRCDHRSRFPLPTARSEDMSSWTTTICPSVVVTPTTSTINCASAIYT